MKSDSERTEREDFVAPGQHRGEAFPPPVNRPTNDRQPTTNNQTIIINSSDGIESESVSEDGKYGICEIKQQRRRGRRRSDGGRGDVDGQAGTGQVQYASDADVQGKRGSLRVPARHNHATTRGKGTWMECGR